VDEQTFNEWGILEVMGRLKMAGVISEQTIAGAGMIRIDVPETNGIPGFTRYFAPGSLYSITPTTEEVARSLAASWRAVPVQRFELPQLAAKTGASGDPLEDRGRPIDDHPEGYGGIADDDLDDRDDEAYEDDEDDEDESER
jgi:hypothetical protein